MASTVDWGKVPAASPSSEPAKKTPRRLSTASSNACRLASRCSGNVPINSDILRPRVTVVAHQFTENVAPSH